MPHFFTYADFYAWKNLVLRRLRQKHSVIHAIVDAGCLPIFSHKSNRWFGVAASLRYRGQKVPKDVPRDRRKRWMLQDLLLSNRYMEAQRRHSLCGPQGGALRVDLHNDLVVPGDASVHTRLHINSLYPRQQETWPWLRGGDLLYACGILFALIEVRYMTVCEGPDVRRTVEDSVRETRPAYFYYNKTVLSSAQSVEYDYTFDDEMYWDDYDSVNCFVPIVDRDVTSTMGCWMWDKQRSV